MRLDNDSNKRLEKDFGEEFGTKLSINPNLPANTDFSGGQNMDTPNSFKCGATPTTPFGLSHLNFPNNITITNISQINTSINSGGVTFPNAASIFNSINQTAAAATNRVNAAAGANGNSAGMSQLGGNSTNATTIGGLSGTTPTMGFGLSFPSASFATVPEATHDDLLNFIPKTPIVPQHGMQLRGFGHGLVGKTQPQPLLSQMTQQAVKKELSDNRLQNFNNPPVKLPNVPLSNQQLFEFDKLTPGSSSMMSTTNSMDLNEMSNRMVNMNAPNLKGNYAKAKNGSRSETSTPSSIASKGTFPSMAKAKSKVKRGRRSVARTNSAAKDESRWKSWTREEEVFLVGAVMDRFFKRGSLSSTRADESTSDDSWSVIKNYYETAWKNYSRRTGVTIPTDRPANALSRHYKVMKSRISQADINGQQTEDFRTYFDEWENIYNMNNCLVADLVKDRVSSVKKVTIKKDDSKVKEFRKRKVRLSVRKERRASVKSATSQVVMTNSSEGIPIREEEEVHEEYIVQP